MKMSPLDNTSKALDEIIGSYIKPPKLQSCRKEIEATDSDSLQRKYEVIIKQ